MDGPVNIQKLTNFANLLLNSITSAKDRTRETTSPSRLFTKTARCCLNRNMLNDRDYQVNADKLLGKKLVMCCPPQCVEMVLECSDNYRFFNVSEKRIPHYPQSLPLEPRRLQELYVATNWNVF
ncbi:hypothetical protein Ddye_004107 [Dipteronia dyeriana]|uniref:Uncharacterized protein n=1 Tax=Dipteronia dyeriana TaxID=168575 RepID=A0AAE0CWR5_9ROSI|nr:hypothetical protein Ddye_004107 [Dipteronia dyeriana]